MIYYSIFVSKDNMVMRRLASPEPPRAQCAALPVGRLGQASHLYKSTSARPRVGSSFPGLLKPLIPHWL